MRNAPIRKLAVLLASAALLALTTASGAAAESTSGTGVVLKKDAERLTLTLDTGRVLQLSERTSIAGPEGQRMSFAQIPAARPVDGGYEARGDEGIRYEGTAQAGGRTLATRVELLGIIPD